MNKYQEASLAGRWVWIGREFLTDHGPMKPTEYLQQVSRLMPAHLRDSDGKLLSRMSLAKKSLQFGFGKGYFVLDGEQIRAVERTRTVSHLRQMILELADRPEGITLKDVEYPNLRTVRTYFGRMAKSGELVRIDKGRYRAAKRSIVDAK